MPDAANILSQIASLDQVAREEIALQLWQGINKTQRQGAEPYFPSIVSSLHVCGGAARLIRTRIPIWTLEQMRRLGASEAEILQSYPNIRAADLVQAWSYADHHRQEMDEAIEANEKA